MILIARLVRKIYNNRKVLHDTYLYVGEWLARINIERKCNCTIYLLLQS